MSKYDLIFITNVPAFYKVNLFNALARHIKIKVIFISDKSLMREGDFYNCNCDFDHVFLHKGNFEERNKFDTLRYAFKQIKESDYNRLVFPGWEMKELFFLSLVSPKRKNAVVIESSILETRLDGLVGHIKKLFLSRMAAAYPSGILQKEILNHCSFNGDIFTTHGVGLANPPQKQKNEELKESVDSPSKKNKKLNYLYVGRLSPEKNLGLLVDVFNETGDALNIVGSGPESESLKKKAKSNIKFLGYISNVTLKHIYQDCDVFVLPSLVEPWGLVVEEALSMGLPVIISDRVGCKEDLVGDNGLIFNATSKEGLKKALSQMNYEYESFKDAVQRYDFDTMYKKQINSYISSLKNYEI